ncbi:MAG: hypothetical protein AAF153_02065, partial [Pseudomonadota bacterium]
AQNVLLHQLAANNITNTQVQNAIMAVDRQVFVPAKLKAVAYADSIIKLDNNNYLMPVSILGNVLDALNVAFNHNLLVIGSGNGYISFVASYLAHEVTSIESDNELVKFQKNLLKLKPLANIALKTSLKSNKTKFDHIILNGVHDTIDNAPKVLEKHLSSSASIVWFKNLYKTTAKPEFSFCQLISTTYHNGNFNHVVIDELSIYKLAHNVL